MWGEGAGGKQRSIAIAVSCLLALGLGIRIYNAFHDPIGWGFDSEENWRYIARLMRSWSLPAPDADWSTAHPPFFYYLSALTARALHPLLGIAGYLLFTIRNPWFAVIKGSFLLGLALPFGVYSSESQSRWSRSPGPRRALIWMLLIALWLLAAVAFTFETHLWKWTLEEMYGPGLRWAPP